MKTEKRTRTIIVILAVLFTLMQLVGWQISMRYGTSVHTHEFFQNIGELSGLQFVFAMFLEVAVWYAVLDFAFYFLGKRKRSGAIRKKENADLGMGVLKKQIWLITGILLFCGLFVGLLACWPGIYSYDAQGQLAQAMYPEVCYVTHHPLLHTLFMGKIMTFGYRISGENLGVGVLMHSVAQMLICCMIFTYAVYFIWVHTKRKWLTVAAFLYYAFFPTVVLFSFCTTKDVLCGAFLHLMVMLTYELYENTEKFFATKRKVVLLLLSGVLMCLFRNNGVYAVALMAVFAGVLFRRNLKAVCLVFIPIIVLSILSNKGLFTALQAAKGSAREALSVPIQQLARVYDEEGEEGFQQEELELLYQAASVEVLQGYAPMISDDVKIFLQFDEAVIKNKKAYLRLWLEVGLRHPKKYIAAFLDNTYQAWYPGTSVIIYPESGKIDYLEIKGFDTVKKTPKIPWLYEIYDKIARKFYYQKIPILRLLFSIGAMFWVTIFTFSYGIWKRDEGITAALLLILCFCATCLLGPVVLVRYYLCLFYIFPVCIAFLMEK